MHMLYFIYIFILGGKQMAYTYELEVKLASAKRNLNLTLKKEIITDAIQRYNQRSYEMQNPKTIYLKKITDETMSLTLESALPLSSLGRALRTFSVIIIKEIKDIDFCNSVTPNGQLFSTKQISSTLTEDENHTFDDYSQITDLDVIKALMDYLYKKRDPDSTIYRKKKAAFEQIKKIAYESGIIN